MSFEDFSYLLEKVTPLSHGVYGVYGVCGVYGVSGVNGFTGFMGIFVVNFGKQVVPLRNRPVSQLTL